MEKEKVYTIKQACGLLSVCKKSLYNYKNAGLISFVNITPGRRGVRQSEIDRYFKQLNGE